MREMEENRAERTESGFKEQNAFSGK